MYLKENEEYMEVFGGGKGKEKYGNYVTLSKIK